MKRNQKISTWARDDPKLPDDSGKVLKLNEVVGGSIPNYEISLYLMKTSQVIERLLYSININTLYFSHLTNHLQTYHLDINVNYNTCFFSHLYAIEQKNYD